MSFNDWSSTLNCGAQLVIVIVTTLPPVHWESALLFNTIPLSHADWIPQNLGFTIRKSLMLVQEQWRPPRYRTYNSENGSTNVKLDVSMAHAFGKVLSSMLSKSLVRSKKRATEKQSNYDNEQLAPIRRETKRVRPLRQPSHRLAKKPCKLSTTSRCKASIEHNVTCWRRRLAIKLQKYNAIDITTRSNQQYFTSSLDSCSTAGSIASGVLNQ